MIKTLFGFIRFFLYLVLYIPKLNAVKKLEKAGKIAERDHWVNQGVHDWARFVVSLAGGTVEVRGEENVPVEGPVVFVGNHQGNFDIPILLGYIAKQKAFISKIEILKIPLLNQWMKLMQCTFIDRKSPRQSVKAMAEAVESVKKGYSLVIFPEGTRSRGKPVGEFKAGSLKLAVKAGVPIVPVTIDGSWRLYEASGRMTADHVVVTLHPPIPTADLSKDELATLHDRVRDSVVSALPQEMRG